MKIDIALTPKKASSILMSDLEKRKLIKLIYPPRAAIETKTKTGTVSRFYTSNIKFGTHTLLCIGKRSTNIKLSWHEDNEDFLLINPLNVKFKKLYLIVALLKQKEFVKKFSAGKITQKDLTAVELEFNNPKLSFFTMLKNTVHCEVTENADGQHPVFFVSEPSNLKDNKLSSKIYNISLATEKP